MADESSLLHRLGEFFFSSDFQEAIDKFVTDNGASFGEAEVVDDVGSDKGCAKSSVSEHGHTQWNLFQDFQRVYDDKLDQFLDRENASREEFEKCCIAAHKDAESARKNLSNMSEDAMVLGLISATSDFDSFIHLMREEVRERCSSAMDEKQAKAKEMEGVASLPSIGDDSSDESGSEHQSGTINSKFRRK